MPRIVQEGMEQHRLGGNFTFTAKRIENLGATEYTLVTIAVDVTGTVTGFESLLTKMLKTAVASCNKSPRAKNLLVRVILFSTRFPSGISELHGFKPLSEIDASIYDNLMAGGGTPLYDAAYSSVGAMNQYGKDLAAQDYLANGIVFVITDGDNNSSVATAAMVKKELQKTVSDECLESMISILIGINAQMYSACLDEFAKDAGMTHYIDAGDATEGKLAKLGAFVSQSVSSQSQALGTGGPSQSIAATI